MDLFASTALQYLQARGYYIEAPQHGADLQRAVFVLAQAGYRVFRPARPPAPGSRWAPTRKGWRGRSREVVASDAEHVWCRWVGEEGEPVKITFPSWRTWRTNARAEQVAAD